MLEVPDAKQVRREDLNESASDDDESRDDRWDTAMRGKLNEQLSGVLDIRFMADQDSEKPQPRDSNEGDGADAEDAEEAGEEFAFRLFRDEEPHKVMLRPQDGGTGRAGDGGFVVPKRPISFYLAEEPPPQVVKEFKMAAVSAEYLFEDAKQRRWGLEKPWKVTTITITTSRGGNPSGSAPTHTATAEKGKGKGKRRRPSKKRRIILRVREKVKKEREEAANRNLMDKEQHLKDKKKRLNRLKKLKRRAKAREEKKGAPGDDAASKQSSRDTSPSHMNEE
ncbi:hypothetical protein F4779DRAFT_574501 [Xylariaceae sp. FL0662B]|nr:hypothetical protein F4779DRAFT_574501 [Xylariaceae sp. FL0662B]